MSRDMEAMFRWMDGHGFGADLELAENLLKRFEIGLMNLRTFLHDHREEFRKAA